jgi:hypothetical protein
MERRRRRSKQDGGKEKEEGEQGTGLRLIKKRNYPMPLLLCG